MKIQPIDLSFPVESIGNEPVKPAVTKSRIKRLLEKQFPSVLRTCSLEKIENVSVDVPLLKKVSSGEFDPSSVCLEKLVRNFIEGSNEKQSSNTLNCAQNRCNCFNGICSNSSDDEFDRYGFSNDVQVSFSGEACETLKTLVLCESIYERNLLADVEKIVEKNKNCKRKDDVCRKIVTDGLLGIGYHASICKSRWGKSSSFPAGEYEYIDVICEGERLLIDIDFRSEFEIARSSKRYKSILQILPSIFVGKSDRLLKLIGIVTETAKQSLNKKGMHFPPWRKAEYVRSKWFSPYTRSAPPLLSPSPLTTNQLGSEETKRAMKEWMPPAIKPRMKSQHGVKKIVTGLASVMENEEP